MATIITNKLTAQYYNIAFSMFDYRAMQVLTVNDHPFDHEIFIMVRRHNASVVAGELDGRIDNVQGPVYDNI